MSFFAKLSVPVLLLCATVAFASGTIDRAQALFNQGKAAQAYQLMHQSRDQFEGTLSFDYLYGRAALKTGHLEVALFAFERVLMEKPDHQAAAFALANTYQKLGHDRAAQEVLLTLLEHEPDPVLMHRVHLYLEKLNPAPSFDATRHNHFYLDLNAGVDSNINRSAKGPIFEVVTEVARHRAFFYSMLLGFYGNQRLSHHMAWFWQVGAETLDNLNQGFDTNSLHALAGLALHFHEYLLRIPAYYQYMMLDGKTFRHIGFVSAELSRFFMENQLQLGLFAEHGTVRYPPNRDPDIDPDVGGAFLVYTSPDHRYYLKLKAYASDSDARTPDPDFFAETNQRYGSQAYGFEAILRRQMLPNHLLVLRLLKQRSRYKAQTYAFSSTRRRDQHTAIDVAWYWKALPEIMLGLHCNYTDNDSNQSLYQYKREAAWVSLRYLFD